MRRYRRGSHSSDAPNAADWAAKVQKLQSPTLQALLKEYVDFPVNQNLCSSIFHFIPSLLPPFLYRRRWIEYVLFCGPTLKSSLLEELSMHIVIEALLVTIICQPLLGDLADPEGIRAGIMYILLYLSCVLQLVCISVHIITVIAIISLDESLVLEWAADKIDAFAVAGYLHTRSYFSFVACVGAWPLLIISGEDPYYVKWICLAVFVVCFLISSLPNGSIGIINSILFPQLQVSCNAVCQSGLVLCCYLSCSCCTIRIAYL